MLIEKLQNNRYMKLYDYRLPYTLYAEGLKELTLIYLPTKDKVRNEYPGNKISPIPYHPCDKYYEQLFSFPPFHDEKNNIIDQKICTSDAVVMHIRRGDFEMQNRILDPKVYRVAIDKIKRMNRYHNKKYFVFSDDMDWCKRNEDDLGLAESDGEVVYVSHNKGNDSWKDIQLMSHAKIMILSNSGFNLIAFIVNRNVEVVLGHMILRRQGGRIQNKAILLQYIDSRSVKVFVGPECFGKVRWSSKSCLL